MANKSNFIKECAAELKKVTWPTRDDVVASVKVVLISTVIIAAILGGFDVLYAKIMRLVF